MKLPTFHYVYSLQSETDGNFYTSYTKDLRKRLDEHQKGQVKSKARRLPVILVYYEACRSQADATKREKYLKTAWGKRYLKGRLDNYLMG